MNRLYKETLVAGVEVCLRALEDQKFELPESLILQVTSSTLKDDGFVPYVNGLRAVFYKLMIASKVVNLEDSLVSDERIEGLRSLVAVEFYLDDEVDGYLTEVGDEFFDVKFPLLEKALGFDRADIREALDREFVFDEDYYRLRTLELVRGLTVNELFQRITVACLTVVKLMLDSGLDVTGAIGNVAQKQ